MLNLKLFLKHRDNNSVFDHIKKNGSVGLPCFVIGRGESIVFDTESLDIEDLKRQENQIKLKAYKRFLDLGIFYMLEMED